MPPAISSTMETRSAHLPLRRCVGIMVVNAQGLVWVGRRRPKWAPLAPHYLSDGCIWQMPQGAINEGERVLDAAFRELREETGIVSVTLLDEISSWLSFGLHRNLIGIALKGKYRGQRLRWFAMRFDGHDSEIDLGPKSGATAEFDDWRWVRPQEVPQLGVPFKRHIYETVVEHFVSVTDGQIAHA